jgi:hypothetical protein
MVTSQEIERQLKAIGVRFSVWGRAEVKELEHIIEPGETIMYCINGYYQSGFAMLCITDHRVLMIDKKPFYLTLEDINYDMISEVDFDGRLFDASINIHSISKSMKFTCMGSSKLRKATAYLQRRILEFRRQSILAEQLSSSSNGGKVVNSIEHRITNPYTRVPFALRRRLPRVL